MIPKHWATTQEKIDVEMKESMVADHGSLAENSGRNFRITVSRSFA
jgi:uncharacterized protein (DUF1786 family)